jgi:hypothetical protein
MGIDHPGDHVVAAGIDAVAGRPFAPEHLRDLAVLADESAVDDQPVRVDDPGVSQDRARQRESSGAQTAAAAPTGAQQATISSTVGVTPNITFIDSTVTRLTSGEAPPVRSGGNTT